MKVVMTIEVLSGKHLYVDIRFLVVCYFQEICGDPPLIYYFFIFVTFHRARVACFGLEGLKGENVSVGYN